jgi:hypothetical protein
MLVLFITAFYGLFSALSVAYVLLQRRRARLVWVAGYLLLVWELMDCMNWSHQQLVKQRIYLEVGHASILLVEVWFSWLLLAVVVLLATWFTLPPKGRR